MLYLQFELSIQEVFTSSGQVLNPNRYNMDSRAISYVINKRIYGCGNIDKIL